MQKATASNSATDHIQIELLTIKRLSAYHGQSLFLSPAIHIHHIIYASSALQESTFCQPVCRDAMRVCTSAQQEYKIRIKSPRSSELKPRKAQAVTLVRAKGLTNSFAKLSCQKEYHIFTNIHKLHHDTYSNQKKSCHFVC